MRKAQELSDPNSCLNKAKPDEMLFVLLGRDKVAATTIRHWIVLRLLSGKNKADDPQIMEAEACADTIEKELKDANSLPTTTQLRLYEDYYVQAAIKCLVRSETT